MYIYVYFLKVMCTLARCTYLCMSGTVTGDASEADTSTEQAYAYVLLLDDPAMTRI